MPVGGDGVKETKMEVAATFSFAGLKFGGVWVAQPQPPMALRARTRRSK